MIGSILGPLSYLSISHLLMASNMDIDWVISWAFGSFWQRLFSKLDSDGKSVTMTLSAVIAHYCGTV